MSEEEALAVAAVARDELAQALGFTDGPERSGVVGIGIGRRDGNYHLAVDVTRDDVPVPEAVRGVPVRITVCPEPQAYSNVTLPRPGHGDPGTDTKGPRG